jgi:hypothetical protein
MDETCMASYRKLQSLHVQNNSIRPTLSLASFARNISDQFKNKNAANRSGAKRKDVDDAALLATLKENGATEHYNEIRIEACRNGRTQQTVFRHEGTIPEHLMERAPDAPLTWSSASPASSSSPTSTLRSPMAYDPSGFNYAPTSPSYNPGAPYCPPADAASAAVAAQREDRLQQLIAMNNGMDDGDYALRKIASVKSEMFQQPSKKAQLMVASTATSFPSALSTVDEEDDIYDSKGGHSPPRVYMGKGTDRRSGSLRGIRKKTASMIVDGDTDDRDVSELGPREVDDNGDAYDDDGDADKDGDMDEDHDGSDKDD